MADTQKNIINAEEIGYMSYNKLNMFMTILLVGFSVVFATWGDRINNGLNGLAGVGIYMAVVVGVVVLIGKVAPLVAGVAHVFNSLLELMKNIILFFKTFAVFMIFALFIIGIILYMFWGQWWILFSVLIAVLISSLFFYYKYIRQKI